MIIVLVISAHFELHAFRSIAFRDIVQKAKVLPGLRYTASIHGLRAFPPAARRRRSGDIGEVRYAT